MTYYYITRDVAPGTMASYKPGRALIASAVHTTMETARREASLWTEHAMVPGITYTVHSCDDALDAADVLGCDYVAF